MAQMAAATPWGVTFLGRLGEALAGRIVATVGWLSLAALLPLLVSTVGWLSLAALLPLLVTKLWVAAARGATEEVRRLLMGGANIELRGGRLRLSPLLAATGIGPVMGMLQASQADPSAKTAGEFDVHRPSIVPYRWGTLSHKTHPTPLESLVRHPHTP